MKKAIFKLRCKNLGRMKRFYKKILIKFCKTALAFFFLNGPSLRLCLNFRFSDCITVPPKRYLLPSNGCGVATTCVHTKTTSDQDRSIAPVFTLLLQMFFSSTVNFIFSEFDLIYSNVRRI